MCSAYLELAVEEHPVIPLHPLTSAVVRVELMFNDLIVAVGSGFVWDNDNSLSLVTAWHNLMVSHGVV